MDSPFDKLGLVVDVAVLSVAVCIFWHFQNWNHFAKRSVQVCQDQQLKELKQQLQRSSLFDIVFFVLSG